ncbi:MAG: histidine phosphatase family protein [Parvibaculum sp.]|uniref:histidine phosphatase family protein n=1 Tax=Parvibaculum sp. TaxID=2024848 RepID=UPI0025F0B61D|nr:histidine phosphatase family protein [Parvibaculum sp.]MCE9648734.1 histidine phosphatase family protein [Parvibaculum sp.]
MPTLYMIRHGEAASGWDADTDPGLSDKGRAQSEAVAREIEKRAGKKLPLISSPLRRCRETGDPLAKLWSATPRIEPRIGEIPSPIEDLKERGEWLRAFMAGTWEEGLKTQGHLDLAAWRDQVTEALVGLTADTVIFSHFVAINAATSAAVNDPRVLTFRPDNCSVTVFETDGKRLTLVERGREAETKVN